MKVGKKFKDKNQKGYVELAEKDKKIYQIM
jgi:hypothetical protein